MLRTPIYDRSLAYCGPVAISAVTGMRVSEIKRIIRHRRIVRWYDDEFITMREPSRIVMGMNNHELVAAMHQLGWRVAEAGVTNNDPYRFRDFLRDHGHSGPYIVNITDPGHYVAVSHGEICDTFSQLPLPIERAHKRLERAVEAWWRFDERARRTNTFLTVTAPVF